MFGLAVLLISGAGLLVRSFINLQAVDAGFDASRILTMQTAPSLNTKKRFNGAAFYPTTKRTDCDAARCRV
jgi:hypothetical protein